MMNEMYRCNQSHFFCVRRSQVSLVKINAYMQGLSTESFFVSTGLGGSIVTTLLVLLLLSVTPEGFFACEEVKVKWKVLPVHLDTTRFRRYQYVQ